MNVTVTARHCTVSDSLRVAVENRVRRLSRFHERLTDAEIIFDGGGGQHRVEGRLLLDGAPPVLARVDSTSFRAALDAMTDRLARQLKRRRQRRQRQRRTGSTPLPQS